MEFNQNWIGYLDRSYEQMKASILLQFPSAVPEITDRRETNPMIALVSFFSGIGEMLNYYIDNMGREAFIGTARQYSSILQLAKLLGYAPKASTPASVDLIFTLTASGVPTTHDGVIIIPKGTSYITGNNILFKQTREVVLLANTTYVIVPVLQVTAGSQSLGISDGSANQFYALPVKYAHGTSVITIDGEVWAPVANKAQLISSTFKGYYITIDETQTITINFGDGTYGKVPLIGQNIGLTCDITDGAAGNVLANTINEVEATTPMVLPTGLGYLITNPLAAVGGTDIEGLEDIRNNAPRSLRTLDRAVTYQDYIDIAKMEREVLTAEVKYCCGKYVEVYVIPKDRSILSSYLVEKLTGVYNCKKMITTKVEVYPAGIARLFLVINLILKPLIDSTTARPRILTILNNNFGLPAAKINGRIFLSDIINVLENDSYIDSVEIVSTKIEPAVRAVKLLTFPLNITFNTLPITPTAASYALIYISDTSTFQVYRDGYIQAAALAIGALYSDALLSFTIGAGTYSNNDSWTFTAYPSYPAIFPSNQLTPNDFSAFIIDILPEDDYIFSTLNFITQGQASSCLPPC